MADSGSLFDSIKQFLPMVATGLAGGMMGGAPGMIAAMGGAEEAQEKQQERQGAQQDRMLQILSEMQTRRAQIEEKQQHDQEWAQLQQSQIDLHNQDMIWRHNDRLEADATRRDLGEQSLDLRKSIADESNSTRLAIAAQSHEDRQDALALRQQIADTTKSNSPPTDEQWNSMLSTLSGSQRDYAKMMGTSPAGRMVALKNLGSWALLNSPGIKGGMTDQLISALKASPHWNDMDEEMQNAAIAKTQNLASGMDGRRLKSLIGSIQAKGITALTPESLEKEVKADRKSDLKASDEMQKAIDKGLKDYGTMGYLMPGKRADYIMGRIPPSAWAGLSSAEKKTAESSLRTYLGGRHSVDPAAAAKTIYPDERAPRAASGGFKAGDTREKDGVTYKRNEKGEWWPVR